MDFYNYDYPYVYTVEPSISDSAFAAILSVYLIVLAVIFIFWIVSYIFHSIGLYTIAKRMGREYPWLAFIPFARDYLHGELAEVIGLKTRAIKNPGIWKLVLPIISGVIFGAFYFIFVGVMGIGAILEIGNSSYGYGTGIGGTIFAIIIVGLIWVLAAIVYEAAYKVLCVLINFQIFGKFTSRNMAIAHSVLSSVVPLYEAICLFVMRNRKFNPGMEPRLTPPPAPIPPVPPVAPEYPVHPEQFAAQGEPQDRPIPPAPPVPPVYPDGEGTGVTEERRMPERETHAETADASEKSE